MCRHHLEKVLSEDVVSRETVQLIKDTTEQCKLHPLLFQVVRHGMRCIQAHPSAQESKWFVGELLSAYDYAHKYDVGRMQLCSEVMTSIRDPIVRNRIADHFIQVISGMTPSWFLFRSICVDVYTTAKITCVAFERGILYGGMKHCEHVRDCLLDKCHWRRCENPTSLVDIVSMCTDDIPMVESITDGSKTLLLLGEYHSKTSMTFAKKFVECMKSRCLVSQNAIALFLERHMKHKEDTSVPEMLACNKSDDSALQHVRCSALLDDSSLSKMCKNVSVYPIDIRHRDLGFLRYELLELRNVDPQMEKISRRFEKRSQSQLVEFLSQWKT
jgi:hypothetical protein